MPAFALLLKRAEVTDVIAHDWGSIRMQVGNQQSSEWRAVNRNSQLVITLHNDVAMGNVKIAFMFGTFKTNWTGLCRGIVGETRYSDSFERLDDFRVSVIASVQPSLDPKLLNKLDASVIYHHLEISAWTNQISKLSF